MPGKDRQPGHLTELLQSPKLVVDECPKRSNVDQIEAPLAGFVHYGGDQRQESRLRLSARCRCRDNQISVILQQSSDRTLLNLPQALPTPSPNPASDGFCEPVEAG